jgi:hypothetical protein
MDNPNLSLMPDKNYQAGYKKKATNKKLSNVFTGFAAGLGVFLMLVL